MLIAMEGPKLEDTESSAVIHQACTNSAVGMSEAEFQRGKCRNVRKKSLLVCVVTSLVVCIFSLKTLCLLYTISKKCLQPLKQGVVSHQEGLTLGVLCFYTFTVANRNFPMDNSVNFPRKARCDSCTDKAT